MVRPSFLKNLSNKSINIKGYIVEFLLYNNFSCFLRRAGSFILRLFRWIPVLWNQEEWDYEFIYDLLGQKMRELHKEMAKDIWHDQKSVQRGLKQIEICLQRLDRWRNWPDYCKLSLSNPENFSKATEFEQKNYDKFWKDFLAWHRGWWT